MFCRNCGVKLDDGVKFCPECGTPTSGDMPNVKNNTATLNLRNAANVGIDKVNSIVSNVSHALPENIRQKISAKTLCCAAVVLVVAIIAIFTLSGRSYRKVVDQYIKGSMTGDSSLIWELFTDNIQKAVLKEEDWEENEAIEFLDEQLRSYIDKLDNQLGENWTYSYEITSEEDYSQEELDECIEDFVEMGVEDFKADAGKHIEVEITISAETLNSEPASRTLDIGVIKIGRSWYLAGF